MKTQINHRYTGAVLFECDVPELVEGRMHIKYVVEQAVKKSADLSYANLRSADLRSADLSYAYLRYADLSYADLSYAKLIYTNLSSADLSYANLIYTNLSSADLRSTELSATDLRSADLSSADLSFADLRSADLSSANLRSADLSYANLRSTELRAAMLRDNAKITGTRPVFTVGPIGSRSDTLTAFNTGTGLILQTGCFFGSLDEFRAALIATHDMNKHREEYEAALTFIEKHFALWGDK